jgi:hypothetical protein
MRRAAILYILFLAAAVPSAGQDPTAARADYFRSVAGFFNLPLKEVAILGDWELAPDEIPVVLFMARRGGVSPEALVALRGGGQSWATLADRYRIGAATLHVPVRDDAQAGVLESAYDRYRSTPVSEWASIRLTEREIIALVNVRVLSQALGLPAERVLARTATTDSFVQLHAQLKR